jgi:hypothetical protein
MRNLALIALLAVAPSMSAQKMISTAPPFAAPRPAAHSSGGAFHELGSPGAFRGPVSHPRSFLYPFGLFSDSFYSDALYSTGYPVAAEPPVIIVQSPPAAASISDRAPSPAQPLMIELRGDHYVRISGEDTSGVQMQTIDSESSRPVDLRRPEKPSSPPTAQPEAHDESPVVLVFRDGHREQISAYTIADGVLYTGGDYYANGSWNKKIELASLNLPETIKTNRASGVSFQLPTSPNEVMVRP